MTRESTRVVSRRRFLLSLGVAVLTLLFPGLLGCGPRKRDQAASGASTTSQTSSSVTIASSSTTVPKKRYKVAIVHGTEVEVMVSKALELLSLSMPLSEAGSLFLKPSLPIAGRMREGGSAGVVTDVRVVAALAKMAAGSNGLSTVIGAGPDSGPASEAFEDAGYTDMAAQAGVELVDLNSAPTVALKNRQANFLTQVELPKVAAEAGSFVNVPVLRTDPLTVVSLGLSNLLGLLPLSVYDRGDFEPHIDQVLADLSKYRHSDLVLIDGLVGLEGGGPLTGWPVPMNLLIASENVVAADTVASQVMGLFPEEIPTIVAAAKAGLGPMLLEEIEVVGENVETVGRKFKKALR